MPSEREVAELVLNRILEEGKMGSAELSDLCRERGANYQTVWNFVKGHVTTMAGYGSTDTLTLLSGSANFVYKGCWSGEERREDEIAKQQAKENRKNRIVAIISAIIAFILGCIFNYIFKLIH